MARVRVEHEIVRRTERDRREAWSRDRGKRGSLVYNELKRTKSGKIKIEAIENHVSTTC